MVWPIIGREWLSVRCVHPAVYQRELIGEWFFFHSLIMVHQFFG
jgi:hypothetical protein